MTIPDLPQAENVLMFRAPVASEQIPHEIAHPASKRYPPSVSDDPLADILFEYSEAEAYEIQEGLGPQVSEQSVQIENFIYAHQSTDNLHVSALDPLPMMLDKVAKQIKRLKEDTKRIKFYMDEVEDYLAD